MIELIDVAARTEATRGVPASVLSRASLSWSSGILVLLGTPADGTRALLGVIAGDVSVRSGRVALDGRPPTDVRGRTAYVPASPELPPSLTVEELWAISRRTRGGTARVADVLEPVGLARLASRRAGRLDPSEARSILLAFALASEAVSRLLVDEPLAALDAAVLASVEERLRAWGRTRALVIATSSVRDAARLGDEVILVSRGVTAPVPPGWLHTAREGARLFVLVPSGDEGGRPADVLAAALAADADVTDVARTELGRRGAHDDVLLVRGADLVPIARAVARAASATSVPIRAMEPDVVPLAYVEAAASLAGGAR